MPQMPAVLLPTRLRRGLVALVVSLAPTAIALVACGGASRPAGAPATSDASVEIADGGGDGAPPPAAPLAIKETKKKPGVPSLDAGKPAQDAGAPKDGGK